MTTKLEVILASENVDLEDTLRDAVEAIEKAHEELEAGVPAAAEATLADLLNYWETGR